MGDIPRVNSHDRSDLVAYWIVPLADCTHTVEFEHGTTTGKRVVWVDGQVCAFFGGFIALSVLYIYHIQNMFLSSRPKVCRNYRDCIQIEIVILTDVDVSKFVPNFYLPPNPTTCISKLMCRGLLNLKKIGSFL